MKCKIQFFNKIKMNYFIVPQYNMDYTFWFDKTIILDNNELN